MKISTPLLPAIAWRNLWRNPRRTLFTLLVVAVGMWSILIFSVMLKSWIDASREASLRLLTGAGQIHQRLYSDDPGVAHRMTPPPTALRAVLDGPGVEAWTSRVRVPAVIQSEYRTRAVTLLGVDPVGERKLSDLPQQVKNGRYLADVDDAEIVLGSDLADRLKTRIGKRVIVLAQTADGRLAEQSFTIAGLFAGPRAVQDEYVFSGRRPVQTMLGVGQDISEISFDVRDDKKLPAIIARMRAAAPADFEVEPWTSLSPLAYAVELLSRAYVGVWLAIMFILMAIGIVNTQLMAVFERTREFGLLQALGLRPRGVMLLVALETGALIALGIVFGAIACALTLVPFAHGLDLGFLADAAEKYGGGRILHPHFDIAEALRLGLVVWLLGLGAALWPAGAAAKISPVEAMAPA